MRQLLTPKQVARAIQVSESSVKRWCDKGDIPTRYTAGGHRRIPLPELLEFLRASNYHIAQPEILGLPATSGRTDRVLGRAQTQFIEALLADDENRCRQILVDLYLAEHALSAICDEVIAQTFVHVGDRWACGEAEVYQERRGCELTHHLVHELSQLLPDPSADAPRAIGASPAGDPYNLATTMVEVVLRDVRWNAASLGDNLPFDTLAAAIRAHRPRLFWLSCSHLEHPDDFLAGYRDLYDEFSDAVAFVVGGRALDPDLRRRMKYAAYCDNLQHLEAFARTLAD